MLLLETTRTAALADLGRLVLSARAAMETPSRQSVTGPEPGGTGGGPAAPGPAHNPASAAAPTTGEDAASVERLMERYAVGDQTAFAPLYHALSPRLFGYLLRLTRDRHLAEDLVQVTFSKVHRARSAYFAGSPVLPWLLAIGRRSFLDLKRRQKVRPEDLTGDGRVPEGSTDAGAAPDDLARELELALDRLPTAYAEAIQLTKVTGLSVAEAAEVLGTTQSAVKLRVHRGYHILRKELESFGRHL